jgi:lipoprotein-releasing system ATP-binding protein
MDNSTVSATIEKFGSNPLVSVRSINKSFENSGYRIDILQEASLDLYAGETISIVGASGIGKSTFLHILGTLDRPDKGQLFFKGKDVFRFNDAALARFRNRSIGFVFQFHHLLPEFSAIENTMMPGLIKGSMKAEVRKEAETILEKVGLQDRMHHRMGELSGGEQQRVALARALVLHPAVLLADEPTGNLDKENSQHIHRLLLELNRELGMTLVVVTHNSDLAKQMFRRITISDGKLEEVN